MTDKPDLSTAIALFLLGCIVVILLAILWMIFSPPFQLVVGTPKPRKPLTPSPLVSDTLTPSLTPPPTSTGVLPLTTSVPTFTPTVTLTASTPASATASPTAPTPSPTVKLLLSGRLAFTLYQGGAYETHVANMDGSGLHKIWNRMHQPDFHPSGERLVVNGELPNYLDLQVIEITPDNRFGKRRRASVNYEDSWPNWSPDGYRIVYVFNIGKRKVKSLWDLREATEGDPLEGPDGLHVRGAGYTVWVGYSIAFTGCDYWDTNRACGIYIMNEGGGHATRITEDPQDRATDGFGDQLLYMSRADGDWEVWRVNSSGGEREQLTDNSAQDGLATWSPDGEHIAFLTNRTGSWEIWAMNADGSEQRSLFSLPGIPGDRWAEERISWGR